MRWTVCMVFIALLCAEVSFAAASVRVVRANCGAVLPMDSTTPYESWWSLKKLLDWRNASNVAGLSSLTTNALTESQLRAVQHITGVPLTQLTLFSVIAASAPSCSVTWDPQQALFMTVEVTSAAVALLPTTSSFTGCQMSLLDSSSTRLMTILDSTSQLNSSRRITLDVLYPDDGIHQQLSWPLSLQLIGGSACAPASGDVLVVLLTNREVPLDRWWCWIPSTVYTAVVAPMALLAVFSSKRPSTTTYSLMMGLVYIGYLGESVGVMMTIAGWQATTGRLFPFPNSVTFHLCLWTGYLLLLPLLVARHPCKLLLFNGVLRCVVYGLFAGHVVAYWVSGFVAIASVGVALLLVTNGILIVLYARFVGLFSSLSKRVEDEFRSMPSSWLAPVSPFVPPLLMYADLFLAHSPSPKGAGSMASPILQEAVTLFNIHSSVPFVLIFVFGSNALLIAATTYHTTFLVPLVQNLILTVWYVLWCGLQIVQERQRWKADSLPVESVLWPAIQTLVDRYNMEVYAAKSASSTAAPSKQSVPAQSMHQLPPSRRSSLPPQRDPPPPPVGGASGARSYSSATRQAQQSSGSVGTERIRSPSLESAQLYH